MIYVEGLRESERKNLLNFINETMVTDEDGFDRAMYLCSEAIEEYVEYRIAERMENKK
jgi:hypothetical protein